MENTEKITEGSNEIDKKFDQKTLNNIRFYSLQNSLIIENRLRELELEWDLERVLEINTGVFALAGTLLSVTDKRWLFITGIATLFMTQQALKGWSPPIPFLRSLGFRTRKEFDKEKIALKSLRGDFDDIYDAADAWRAIKD
jgi:hypothetical protein